MIEGRIRKFGPVVLTAQWNRVTPIISTRFGAIEGEGRRGAPPRLVVQHLLVMARNNASRGSVGSLLSLGNRKGAPSDNLSFPSPPRFREAESWRSELAVPFKLIVSLLHKRLHKKRIRVGSFSGIDILFSFSFSINTNKHRSNDDLSREVVQK